MGDKLVSKSKVDREPWLWLTAKNVGTGLCLCLSRIIQIWKGDFLDSASALNEPLIER